jgi:hypothetical protein
MLRQQHLRVGCVAMRDMRVCAWHDSAMRIWMLVLLLNGCSASRTVEAPGSSSPGQQPLSCPPQYSDKYAATAFKIMIYCNLVSSQKHQAARMMVEDSTTLTGASEDFQRPGCPVSFKTCSQCQEEVGAFGQLLNPQSIQEVMRSQPA